MCRLCGSVAPNGSTAACQPWPRTKSWVCSARTLSFTVAPSGPDRQHTAPRPVFRFRQPAPPSTIRPTSPTPRGPHMELPPPVRAAGAFFVDVFLLGFCRHLLLPGLALLVVLVLTGRLARAFGLRW